MARNKKYWSGDVTKHKTHKVKRNIFTSKSPKKIALSLKASAQRKKAKTTTYQTAMSMLNFYINRAGENLPASQKKVLNQAKKELKKLFGKENE